MDNKQKLEIIKKNQVKLSWWLLEQKLFYYYPEYGKCVSDDKYDAMEEKYKKYCKILNIPTTVTDYVGFPIDKGSGKIVMDKYKNRIK